MYCCLDFTSHPLLRVLHLQRTHLSPNPGRVLGVKGKLNLVLTAQTVAAVNTTTVTVQNEMPSHAVFAIHKKQLAYVHQIQPMRACSTATCPRNTCTPSGAESCHTLAPTTSAKSSTDCRPFPACSIECACNCTTVVVPLLLPSHIPAQSVNTEAANPA